MKRIMKDRDFTLANGKKTMNASNVMAEFIDEEGDSFTCNLCLVKDGIKSESVNVYFKDINEMKGLANYLVGLAEDLKHE